MGTGSGCAPELEAEIGPEFGSLDWAMVVIEQQPALALFAVVALPSPKSIIHYRVPRAQGRPAEGERNVRLGQIPSTAMSSPPRGTGGGDAQVSPHRSDPGIRLTAGLMTHLSIGHTRRLGSQPPQSIGGWEICAINLRLATIDELSETFRGGQWAGSGRLIGSSMARMAHAPLAISLQ